jgi:hypothetical protein
MSHSSESDRILAFYLGQQPNPQDRTIEDIWLWNYQKLESVHNYIQWLFPLREKSRFNTSAPTLSDRAMQAFRASEELKNRLVKSLKMMLAFYGLECREGENKALHHGKRCQMGSITCRVRRSTDSDSEQRFKSDAPYDDRTYWG